MLPPMRTNATPSPGVGFLSLLRLLGQLVPSAALASSLSVTLILPIGATAATPGIYRLESPAPRLASDDGERIYKLEIHVTCGRFRGITNIPDDWSVEVISPESEQTTLRAEAGHGAASLWNLQPLDGAIRIEVKDWECFTISALVQAEEASSRRTISWVGSQLHLVR